MQSFFVTLFSVLQRITQQIQREFDRSFNLLLLFFKCCTWFQRTTLWCKWKKWHICCGLGANNSRQAVKQGSPTSTPTTSNPCSLLIQISHRKVQVPYPNLSWHVFWTNYWLPLTFSHVKQCSRASSRTESIHPTFRSWEEQAFAWINR